MGAVVDRAARSMQLEQRLARRYVREMVRRWRELGLLRAVQARRSFERRGNFEQRAEPGPTKARPQKVDAIARWRYYRVLGTNFCIGFSDELMERTIHPVLGHLERPWPGADAVPINIVMDQGELQVWSGDGLLESCTTIQRLAPVIQGIVGGLALRRYRFVVALHAGGISLDNQAMLLVAASGGGKTTLTAALAAAGWDYLSDDTVLLRPQTLSAVGVPYSLGIKRGGWALLASRYPRRRSPAMHLRPDGEPIRYISPLRPRGGFAQPHAVTWILFLHRSANGQGDLRPLSRLAGIQRLMQHCCGIPRALTSDDVKALLRWSAGIRWFDFHMGDLDLAVDQLTKLVARQPRRPR